MSKAQIRPMKIFRRYFDMIEKGEKTIEVRVGYARMRRIKEGDTIRFFTKGSSCDSKVIRVTEYSTFEEMMAAEEPAKINPHEDAESQLKAIRGIFPPEKEKLGVLVFELSEN